MYGNRCGEPGLSINKLFTAGVGYPALMVSLGPNEMIGCPTCLSTCLPSYPCAYPLSMTRVFFKTGLIDTAATELVTQVLFRECGQNFPTAFKLLAQQLRL